MQTFTCSQCYVDLPAVKTDLLTEYGNAVYHDEKAQKWAVRWSNQGQILSAKCPPCNALSAHKIKSAKSNKRMCGICKKALPLHRRYNHEGCINMRSYHNFDGDWIYFGSSKSIKEFDDDVRIHNVGETPAPYFRAKFLKHKHEK